MTVNTDATAIEPLNQECKITEESPAFSGISYQAGTLFFNHCLNRNGFKSALEIFFTKARLFTSAELKFFPPTFYHRIEKHAERAGIEPRSSCSAGNNPNHQAAAPRARQDKT